MFEVVTATAGSRALLDVNATQLLIGGWMWGPEQGRVLCCPHDYTLWVLEFNKGSRSPRVIFDRGWFFIFKPYCCVRFRIATVKHFPFLNTYWLMAHGYLSIESQRVSSSRPVQNRQFSNCSRCLKTGRPSDSDSSLYINAYAKVLFVHVFVSRACVSEISQTCNYFLLLNISSSSLSGVYLPLRMSSKAVFKWRKTQNYLQAPKKSYFTNLHIVLTNKHQLGSCEMWFSLWRSNWS